jgi:hypothetical protein
MNKIKDIREFSKMFNIVIPMEDHFEYYINTLSKSFEFVDLSYSVNKFSEFEEWLTNNSYQNIGNYKMGYAYNTLKNYLNSSNAYQKCREFDYSKTIFYTKNSLKTNEESYMLSLDFSSANFQSIKIFDKDDELKSSWLKLCEFLKIHPTVALSKGFRQVVFGCMNPQLFGKIQHHYILKLVKELSEFLPDEEFNFISCDETIINLGIDKDIACKKAEDIQNLVKELKIKRFENNQPWMNIHYNIFTMKKISKDVYIKEFFVSVNGTLCELYKSLFGCPKNIYFINFKKHIINEGIVEEDCVFTLNNRLAKWIEI